MIGGAGRPVRSVREAASFVRRAGVALVFPTRDLLLPSLWEAVTGTSDLAVFDVDEGGRRTLSPEFDGVWALMARLAAERTALVGKHVKGRLALVAPELLPALYALTGRSGRVQDFRRPGLLSPMELALATALNRLGPRTGPELRQALGLKDARATKRALESLQRMLVVTRAGDAPQPQGWEAAVHDLTARRFADRLKRLPGRREAIRELSDAIRAGRPNASAADISAVLRVGRNEVAAVAG